MRSIVFLILILLLVFLILVVRLYLQKNTEGFQSDLDSTFQQEYSSFATFYNKFLDNWTQAAVSSIYANMPQEPLQSPTDVSSSSAVPNQPSKVEMNIYIEKLSQQLGLQLPPITSPLPTEISSQTLPSILSQIPTDVTPYLNALTWMNTQLQKSHVNLGSALQGLPIEPFDDMCQNVSQCITQNPQLAQQIANEVQQQQQQNQSQTQQQQQQQILQRIQAFTGNNTIQQAFYQNQTLIAKSQQIQNEAQNGDLIHQVNIPGSKTQISYSMPPGGNALSQMQQSDPQKYNEYKQNYGAWFQLKQLIEQINQNL